MIKAALIEQIIRKVYGGQPSDDAGISRGLVNQYVNAGLALAAKQNYTDNLKLEGVGYVNNSFYTTFKNLVITQDEENLYKFTLPQIPLGLGDIDGVSRLVFKAKDDKISKSAVMLSQSQISYMRTMRTIPNRIMSYYEGDTFFLITALIMTAYTAQISMVSGGSATDYNSQVNIPNDYIPFVTDYVYKELMGERSSPVSNVNDGVDIVKSV